MQVKTWMKRRTINLEGPALTWLLKALSFAGLALALSVIILLLGCASPCHPVLGLAKNPPLSAPAVAAGTVDYLGFACAWR